MVAVGTDLIKSDKCIIHIRSVTPKPPGSNSEYIRTDPQIITNNDGKAEKSRKKNTGRMIVLYPYCKRPNWGNFLEAGSFPHQLR